MVGSYVTGIFPRPNKLIEATRAYERGKMREEDLERFFIKASDEVIRFQVKTELSYVTDGMLKWQDLLRPFTDSLKGVERGTLTRWFNNNVFYRKPIITGRVSREHAVVPKYSYLDLLPKKVPWKAILPAPYTFAQLSDNRFYEDKLELMFEYAEVLREELKELTTLGFKYFQLSDPSLVYRPVEGKMPKDELEFVKDALKKTVKGVSAKICLQTFFGDFNNILPEALEFPVDHLGIDLYETDIKSLKEYEFDKGVALGMVDSRSSLIEEVDELVSIAKDLIESIYPSKIREVFICPNCDLEFLPWERAKAKIEVISRVAKALEVSLSG